MLRPTALRTVGRGMVPSGFLEGVGRTMKHGRRCGGKGGLESSGRGHAGGGGASPAWRKRAARVFERGQIIRQCVLGLYSDGASLLVPKPN